jgi:hypothetical protein
VQLPFGGRRVLAGSATNASEDQPSKLLSSSCPASSASKKIAELSAKELEDFRARRSTRSAGSGDLSRMPLRGRSTRLPTRCSPSIARAAASLCEAFPDPVEVSQHPPTLSSCHGLTWLDHGIHSVTLLIVATVTEWIAGSSPAMTTLDGSTEVISRNLSPPQKPELHSSHRCSRGTGERTGTFREQWAAPCWTCRIGTARRSPKGSIQGREPFARCRFAACPFDRRPPGLQAAREGRVDELDFVTAARGAS